MVLLYSQIVAPFERRGKREIVAATAREAQLVRYSHIAPP
jgi:hypothetical protein